MLRGKVLQLGSSISFNGVPKWSLLNYDGFEADFGPPGAWIMISYNIAWKKEELLFGLRQRQSKSLQCYASSEI